MDNGRVVYVNVLAEGARITEPQVLTDENIRLVARTWQRGETVIHTLLIGMETIQVGKERHRCLIGDVGAAKILLPVENAGLRGGQQPMDLAGRWVSVVIEETDYSGVPVLMVNRKKALTILQGINEKRVEIGRQCHGVVQIDAKGAYVMNVGGYEALLPKAFYDWDLDKKAKVGEEFSVQVIPSKIEDRLVVNRRALLPNPFETSNVQLESGTLLKVKLLYITGGAYKAESNTGIKVNVDPINMREIPTLGDEVIVRVFGRNKQGYYGSFA